MFTVIHLLRYCTPYFLASSNISGTCSTVIGALQTRYHLHSVFDFNVAASTVSAYLLFTQHTWSVCHTEDDKDEARLISRLGYMMRTEALYTKKRVNTPQVESGVLRSVAHGMNTG